MVESVDCLFQLFPPSFDFRIAFSPITQPVFASTKEISVNALIVPLDWLNQLLPPSVVLRIVPTLPTAVPVVSLVKQTPYRYCI